MSLGRRLDALERRARAAGYLTGEPPCPSRGGPDPDAMRVVVVDATQGEEVPKCPTCGRDVDEEGRDIGRFGMTITLHPGRPDVPLPGA